MNLGLIYCTHLHQPLMSPSFSPPRHWFVSRPTPNPTMSDCPKGTRRFTRTMERSPLKAGTRSTVCMWSEILIDNKLPHFLGGFVTRSIWVVWLPAAATSVCLVSL